MQRIGLTWTHPCDWKQMPPSNYSCARHQCHQYVIIFHRFPHYGYRCINYFCSCACFHEWHPMRNMIFISYKLLLDSKFSYLFGTLVVKFKSYVQNEKLTFELQLSNIRFHKRINGVTRGQCWHTHVRSYRGNNYVFGTWCALKLSQASYWLFSQVVRLVQIFGQGV